MLESDNEEQIICKEFLEMFTIESQESTSADQIDITLLLKAVPSKIIDKKLDQVKKFHFLTLQSAFNYLLNCEDEAAFSHYDELNKTRVNTIKNLIQD